MARANGFLPAAAPVIPIIEPVIRNWHSEWHGLAEWIGGNRKALLVVNPYQKEFVKHREIISNVGLKHSCLLDHDHMDTSNLLPTMLIHEKTDLAEIERILESQEIKAVIHRRTFEGDVLISRLKNSPVEYHIFDSQTVPQNYWCLFKSKHGNVVLNDAFVKAANNQSYPEIPHKLHDLPMLCSGGDVLGFADHLIELQKHPTPGGNSAKAAAIHIGYTQAGNEGVWMHHFVGGPIKHASYPELFLPAAEKLSNFKEKNPDIWLDSYGCNRLLDSYRRKQKMQPSDVKEFSLLHYIEAMNQFCLSS